MIVIGTTSACALKLFRNSVALEKDEEQVSFINMRIKALWEVGAKHIVLGEQLREIVPWRKTHTFINVHIHICVSMHAHTHKYTQTYILCRALKTI